MLDLVPADARVLHTPAEPVERITPVMRHLAQEMLETCAAKNGLGLAAPQVGMPLQMIVTIYGGVYFNVSTSGLGPKHELREECLSLPGQTFYIERFETVTVTAMNLEGQPTKFIRRGLEAQLFQHEVDHLQGRLIDGSGIEGGTLD